MLNKLQTAQLKAIVQDEKFEVVRFIINSMIEEQSRQSIKKDSEFETLWAAAQQDALISTLNRLLNIIEQEAYA